MITIDWVLVRTADSTRAAECEFAIAELRRQLPAHTRWLFGAEAGTSLADDNTNAGSVVLVLEHPWLTLDRHCLEYLGRALEQGYDRVEACDSRFASPMGAGGYATQRGMERFVDGYEFHVQDNSLEAGHPKALVQMTTVGALRRHSHVLEKSGRVRGAFAHDFSSYFGSDRAEVLGLVPTSARRFLDIGGGEGNFLSLLKSSRGAETHLVELDADVAGLAMRNHKADHVWNGDFLQYQSSLRFDCVSFLDMLEHVVHPHRYLAHARTLLSHDGVVLASIPNVGHWSVVADLIEGRWDYVPAGIHCITHLRFFTEKTIRDLFDAAGLVIERMERVHVPGPVDLLDQWQQSRGLDANRSSLDTYAHLILGRPSAKAQ